MGNRTALNSFLALLLSSIAAAQSLPSSSGATRSEEAIVRGRCVETGSRLPLAGARVSFGGWAASSEEMAKHGNPEAPKLEPLVTGADGVFEFRFVPPPPLQWSLHIDCEGRAPRTARWGRFAPGQCEDLGTVELARGYRVRGRIVDEADATVAQCPVEVRMLPLPIRQDMAANDVRGGRSDDQGNFEIECLLPAGTYPIESRARGFVSVQPATVFVREERGAEPVTLVVKRLPSISGVVVDEEGKPVAKVYLRADVDRNGRMTSAWTRADGRFVLWSQGEPNEPVTLFTQDAADCEPWRSPVRFAWGSKDVRIVLTRLPTLELTVVEKATGAPVEMFSVVCHAPDARSSSERRARLGGAHPGGRLVVDKLRRGANELVVVPNDRRLRHSGRMVLTVGDGEVPPLRVELERHQEVPVIVRLRGGPPVAGTMVELCVPHEGHPVALTGIAIDYELGEPFTLMMGSLSNPELLCAGTTDATGTATLLCTRLSPHAVLRLLGPGHAPKLVPLEGLAQKDGAYEVDVDLAGEIVGRVVPAGVPGFEVEVRIASAGAQDVPYVVPARVLEDGTFRFENLPPGDWTLRPEARITSGDEHGRRGLMVPLVGAELVATTHAGKPTPVTVDLEKWQPGVLEGIVTLDDKAPEHARIRFVPIDGRPGRSAGPFFLEPTGRFRAEGLLPDRYRVELKLGSGADAETIVGDEEVEVPAKGRVRHEFRLRRE